MFREMLFFFLSFTALGINLAPGAQSAAELLEEAIYAEESVGDLEGALAIYDRIIDQAQAERRYIAQALLRKGGCHLKRGEEELATVAFRQLVEAYPDQPDLVARAREHLPEEVDPEPGLPLGPVPWKDGELLRYTLSVPSRGAVGDMTYSMRSATAGGRPAWRIENRFQAPGGEVSKLSWVEADAETLRPIRGLLRHSQLGTASAEYLGEERRLMLNRPGEEPEPYTQRLAGAVYDNEQAVQIIRRLPLEEGYEVALQLAGRPGSVSTVTIQVQGRAKITVPAGTFDCFKVVVTVPPYSEVQWISADEHRYPVKIDNPQALVELREITSLSGRARDYRSERAALELTVPEGWDVFESAFSFGMPELVFQLFPPEMRAGAVLCVHDPKDTSTVEEFARKDIGIYQSRRESFVVREESWNERRVASRPAVSFVADLEMGEVPYAEYRVYVAGDSHFYWFVFRDRRDRIEERMGEFEGIVSSLRLEGP